MQRMPLPTAPHSTLPALFCASARTLIFVPGAMLLSSSLVLPSLIMKKRVVFAGIINGYPQPLFLQAQRKQRTESHYYSKNLY